MYIDLGSEKIIAAQKDEQKIAVEIKSFIGASTISVVIYDIEQEAIVQWQV
jgi:XisH protein